jgi:hypothetical protein
MSKPTKVLPWETIKRWKQKATRDHNSDWEVSGVWAERRLLEVINSHEALRRVVAKVRDPLVCVRAVDVGMVAMGYDSQAPHGGARKKFAKGLRAALAVIRGGT